MLVKKPVDDSKKKVLFDLFLDPSFTRIVTKPAKANSALKIETIDLDTALDMENRVDWLLIDVLGSEGNVLNGAKNILGKYAPKILIEILPSDFDKIEEILTNEGYSISCLNNTHYYAIK